MLFVLLLAYGFFALRDYRSLPQIVMVQGQERVTTASTSLEYIFDFDNVEQVQFLGSDIEIDTEGQASVMVYPLPGYNHYEVRGISAFGREKNIAFSVFKSE
tara:strand:+ start:91 stop:396 length:306 start_codon:yes stop_codon:yes gene_type:complete